MRAGAGSCAVSLSLPTKHQDHQLDPLFVKVLRTEEFILVSFDVTSMPGEVVQYFQEIVSRKTGLDSGRVIISVTHSFSAPHFNDTSCLKAFEEALVKALDEVVMKECSVGWSEGSCAVNVQRNIETPEGWWIGRNPEGPSDRSLRSIWFYHEDKPFACLVNYALQSSCVMELDPSAISADIPGALAEKMRQRGIHCFFLPGACADQVPADADHKKLAETMYRELIPGPGQPLHSEKIKNTTFSAETQKMKYSTKELRPHRSYEFENTGESEEIPLTILHINDIVLCMTAPELNSGFGEELRGRMPEKCMVATMVNGACKYMPEDIDFERITYQAMNTMIAKGQTRKLTEALERELE